MQPLVTYFAALEDPRVVGRASHPLLTVVVMALAAVVAGCNGWEEIEAFCQDRKDWFARFLDMPHGVPDETTFARVFRAVRRDVFAQCMTAWVQDLAAPLDGEVVAFDGKTVRGALRRAGPLGGALHAVHVWATKQRLLLAQAMVPGAPEEVPAVRDLLALLDLRGAIVTGDAAHCTRETAQSILDAEAAWLLHLKGNRSGAHARVADFFAVARTSLFAGLAVRHHRTEDAAHGRVEIREAWSVPATACPLPGSDWPGLQSVTLIERTRTVDGATSCERHYYLSSLPPRVKRIAAAAREHWRVENDLHWTLDVQMGEDACAVHDENGAANLATLRRLALMMAKRETSYARGTRPKSVRAKQAKAMRSTEYLEKLLTAGIQGN
jgi:predicted transposase YbfD/YdcC